MAVARNDAGLRWSAVTIDSGDDARSALDRITIPQDVLDRVAPTALPRSSIIILKPPAVPMPFTGGGGSTSTKAS